MRLFKRFRCLVTQRYLIAPAARRRAGRGRDTESAGGGGRRAARGATRRSSSARGRGGREEPRADIRGRLRPPQPPTHDGPLELRAARVRAAGGNRGGAPGG